jgi:hypothetical protein
MRNADTNANPTQTVHASDISAGTAKTKAQMTAVPMKLATPTAPIKGRTRRGLTRAKDAICHSKTACMSRRTVMFASLRFRCPKAATPTPLFALRQGSSWPRCPMGSAS